MKKIARCLLGLLVLMILLVSCDDPFGENASVATAEELEIMMLAQQSSEIAAERFPDAFKRTEDWNGFGQMKLLHPVSIEETGVTITYAKGYTSGNAECSDMRLLMRFSISEGGRHRLIMEILGTDIQDGIPGIARIRLDGRTLSLPPLP